MSITPLLEQNCRGAAVAFLSNNGVNTKKKKKKKKKKNWEVRKFYKQLNKTNTQTNEYGRKYIFRNKQPLF